MDNTIWTTVKRGLEAQIYNSSDNYRHPYPLTFVEHGRRKMLWHVMGEMVKLETRR